MQESNLILDYAPRPQFVAFHQRRERFACIVTHRRAGKTVACVHDLQRDAIEPIRPFGATAHESELRVDYPKGGQVRLYGADNPDAMRGIYLDGIVLDEYADMDPRVWSEIIRPALADRGRLVLADAQGERDRAHSR